MRAAYRPLFLAGMTTMVMAAVACGLSTVSSEPSADGDASQPDGGSNSKTDASEQADSSGEPDGTATASDSDSSDAETGTGDGGDAGGDVILIDPVLPTSTPGSVLCGSAALCVGGGTFCCVGKAQCESSSQTC